MARDNKIRMPSGQGGLTRYFDEFKSSIEFSPAAVVVMCVVVMILIILLHYFGGGFLQ
jgi:preprotein translocase subunit Sec61beta